MPYFRRNELDLDEDRESGIELILRFCEQLRIMKCDEELLSQLENEVLSLERSLQEIDESGGRTKLLDLCRDLLKKIGKGLLDAFDDVFTDKIILKRLINLVHLFHETLRYSSKLINDHQIIHNFMQLMTPSSSHAIGIQAFPSGNYSSIKKENLFPSLELSNILKPTVTHLRLFVDDEHLVVKDVLPPFPDIQDKWDLKLIIKNEKSISKAGYLLWTIGTALESIDGVSAEISDLGKGSLWFKIQIFFNDLVAKEETKEILHKAREAAEAHYLKKPVEESKRIQSEKEKTTAEAELLKIQAQQLVSSENSKLTKLEIESKEIENRTKLAELEAKNLENKFRKLELIEKLSSLIASGIIEADELQININEVLYLTKNHDAFLPGEPLDEIEKGKTGLTDQSKSL